jgi:hypothetical protein
LAGIADCDDVLRSRHSSELSCSMHRNLPHRFEPCQCMILPLHITVWRPPEI